MSRHGVEPAGRGHGAAGVGKAQQKFAEACEAFCVQQGILTARKRQLRRCSEFEQPHYETGNPGSPGCNLDTEDPESLCDRCRYRVMSRPAYRDAIKARYAARRKMMHWFNKERP